ncbi:hypothetical protein U5A82_18325 [Sphingobium sp. CR2-8]|uniref:hypothetical protein n=1 Tax=Sphingobium sp. CR2-8 TaxID=1306534 RepID=UPI002DBA6540|nr:hypothetical protein [Sphingobium sp. CR2-8]MEC3912358.1 hypothetical protein [Sphingobium sp. CR2-8]
MATSSSLDGEHTSAWAAAGGDSDRRDQRGGEEGAAVGHCASLRAACSAQPRA